jgi:arabinogalactan endo-1,4-beta-galactosidase
MSVLEKFKLVELITTRTDAVATFITGNQIKFNSATHVDLGYPAYIQLFVDEKGKQFAIKACKENDPNAMKFSKPAGEQRYPIKITCAPAANAVRKVMEWTQSMNVPGAIFADEGVIIFALEQAFPPVPKGGGWAIKRQRDAEAAAAATEAEDTDE